MRSLSLALYRALLMTVDRTAQTYPALSHITLREPVYGEIGSSSTGSTAAGECRGGGHLTTPEHPQLCILAECHLVSSTAAYLLESLESLVPGCEVPAQEPNLSWKDVKRLIRLAYCLCLDVLSHALLLQTVPQSCRTSPCCLSLTHHCVASAQGQL